MLFLLSPAKKLDYDSPLAEHDHTQPLFVAQAAALIELLKTQSVSALAELMGLSQTLAELNVQRYARWQRRATQSNARQALLAFNGDVYEGLNAATLSASQLAWAQKHLVILSGLYGVLRPLDLMQPYRLEMGTRLPTSEGKNLYAYWSRTITAYLNAQHAAEPSAVIVNLASEEYFKAVDIHTLRARVVHCVFQDYQKGAWKVVGFYAKRARGLMARYAIEHKVRTAEELQAFNSAAYAYTAAVSTPEKLVFRRSPR